MKIIDKKTNEVKEVSAGYAVNYLLPQGLAVVATAARIKDLKKKQIEKNVIKKQTRLQNQQQAGKLDGKVINLEVKAGKSGKIHGSITKKDLAKELGIMKGDIKLDKPIKKIGEYDIQLVFGKVRAKVKVKVVAERKEEMKD